MTDKFQSGITEYYEELFKGLKNNPIKLLELGIRNGDSLIYFSNYFVNGKIFGLDHKLPDIKAPKNVEMVQGWQDDIMLLQSIGNKKGMFNVIIDDCSHYGSSTQKSFDFLFEYLVPGGLYIIEDFVATFRSPQWRGLDDVVCNIIKNFKNYNLEKVEVIKLPQGGSLALIKKL